MEVARKAIPAAKTTISCSLPAKLGILSGFQTVAQTANCREEKRESGTEHVTIKGKFTLNKRMFQLESEGTLTDALDDFRKQYDVELNRKDDDLEDSEMKI